ncbi:MAG TPA: hypothetical protein VMR33_10940 [Candidatus Baltobacteraceae bacterium]|nr:hypothetical protein [Candidatus Baltobacteraceae bacterium]
MKKSVQPRRIQETLMAVIGKGIHAVKSPAALALTVLLALTQWARAQDNLLVNPGFEEGNNGGWTAVGNTPVKEVGPTDTYYNAGLCAPDATAEPVVSHSGDWVGNIYGNFSTPVNYSSWSQTFPTLSGATFTAGAWTYVSHEDMMAGENCFYYEVDFLNASNVLLASYESFVITNLNCPPTNNTFPLDTWVFLAATNEMTVTSGTNTGAVSGNTGSSGILTAPANAATIRWTGQFVNVNGAGGSVYLDDCDLIQLSGPVPPSLTAISPNGVILATNTALTCTATSDGLITNVQIVVQSHGLTGGTNTVTNTLASPEVTGLGTASASVNYPLTTNLIYTATVTAKDNFGFVVTGTTSFDTMAPTLVIEAEDFNYSGGEYTNTPPNGGLSLYHDLVGTALIDEFKQPGNGTQGDYRPSDAVIIQHAAPDNGTEQKYVTAAANGDTNSWDVPQEVGYNTVGDWLDYTRDFGSASTNSAPAGTYYIWGRIATDGDGNDCINMYEITSNPTQSDQSSNLLGSFSFADSDWNGFDYAPMADNFGNLVSVTLSGHETLRATVANGPNIDFYMLVPAVPILTPSLKYSYPDGVHPFEPTNDLTFTIGAANGAGIESSAIHLILNGVDVTSKLTLTGATNSWTANYPILSNTVYSAVIDATNSDGLSSTFTINFDTFNPANFQWEADDYDYSTNNGSIWVGGHFIDNSVPSCDTTAAATGHEATNSYYGFPADYTPGLDPFGQGAIAQQGIDFTCASPQPQANDYYRADGQGSQPATDYLRPKFVAARAQFSDNNIGPFNLGWTTTGDWENYTRTYPTGNFYVYGRIAGGATANGAFEPWSGEQLDLVTSGVGTPSQTTNILGTFSDQTPAGYQAWHWVPLRDTSSNMVVVSLAGKTTLQIVCGGPGVNEEFYMLVPAPAQSPQPLLGASLVDGQLNISIPTQTGYSYQVYFSPSLSPASWTATGSPITGDGTTHVVVETMTGQQGYYEVR